MQSLLEATAEHQLIEGDCIIEMGRMPSACVDLAVFSPPFPSVFAYSDSPADLGNSEDLQTDAKLHFSFFFRQLVRVLKPGRVAIVHCMQIPRTKRSGGQGVFDFRGLLIRLGERAGLVFEYDWMIRKNPQAQAIRTRKWELKFQGLEADRAQSRGALPDYLLKFRAPGENAVRVDSPGEVSRNDWIDWAECCWSDIRETDTLNVRTSKSESDTKHICPLQLGVIDRIVRLYTNPGELVFSPFAGIGSEGYIALKRGRRFYGIELKPEYCTVARENFAAAIRQRENETKTMFD